MQLQFHKSPLRFLTTVLQNVQSTEVTQEIRLTDGMPDIGRVLNSWGQVVLRSKQWQGNTIGLTAGIMVWSLYIPEDGTEPRVVESWIPVQLYQDVTETDREGLIRIIPALRFVDSRSTSARKIMIRAGVTVLIQAMCRGETEIYTPSDVPEDVQLLKQTYPLRIPVESGEKTFQIDEDVVLSDDATESDKLLCVTVLPEITEKKMLPDKVIFKGNLNCRCMTRDQEGNIHCREQQISFSQLSELDGVCSQNAAADIRMAVTNLETDMPEPGKLRVKCGLVAQYLVDDQHMVEIVQDAYSPYREVKPEIQVISVPTILEDRTEYLNLRQSIPGQIGTVIDSTLYMDFPRVRGAGDSAELDLTGLFQTLIQDEHESLQSVNSRWEGSLKLPVSENAELMATYGNVGPVNSMRAGENLDLASQVQLQIRTTVNEHLPVVAGLDIGAENVPDPARPSLVIMAPGGSSLWEIAKSNGSTVSAICSANGIDEANVSDQLLLIPII